MRPWKPLLTAAALAVALIGPAKAQTTWNMASGYPENNFLTQNLRIFVSDVEKAADGKLKITLHSNDSLIKLDGIKRAVQTGQIQAGEIRFGVYGNEDAMNTLEGVPFVASTYDEAWKLMQAQKPYYDAMMTKASMKVLGYQVWPSQGFYTKTQITSPDDFKGKKLRIYSPPTQKMGTMLGFQATILPFAEIPQAFSTGLIEALFTSAQTGVDIQAWDNTKYFTNVGAILSKNGLIVNQRAFAALPKDVQDAMLKAGEDYTMRAWTMSKAAHEKNTAILREHGMVVEEAPPNVVAAMKKVGAAMAEEWKASASPEAVAVLETYNKTN